MLFILLMSHHTGLHGERAVLLVSATTQPPHLPAPQDRGAGRTPQQGSAPGTLPSSVHVSCTYAESVAAAEPGTQLLSELKLQAGSHPKATQVSGPSSLSSHRPGCPGAGGTCHLSVGPF